MAGKVGHFLESNRLLPPSLFSYRRGLKFVMLCSHCLFAHIVSRSRTVALSYGDPTLGGAELDVVKSLRITGVIVDSKLTVEGSCVNNSQESGGLCRTEKLFNCPRVLKGYFNAYVSTSLEYCVPVWLSSAESHLDLLDSIVRSA